MATHREPFIDLTEKSVKDIGYDFYIAGQGGFFKGKLQLMPAGRWRGWWGRGRRSPSHSVLDRIRLEAEDTTGRVGC